MPVISKLGQEADNSHCLARLRPVVRLAWLPNDGYTRLSLKRQKLHGTDSELFSQGRRDNLAVAEKPSALNMQAASKNNGMSSAIFSPATDIVNCNIE